MHEFLFQPNLQHRLPCLAVLSLSASSYVSAVCFTKVHANSQDGTCAYAVLKLEAAGMKLLQQFSTDEQLVYGFDWCHNESAEATAATCSFYDQSLRLWKLDLEL